MVVEAGVMIMRTEVINPIASCGSRFSRKMDKRLDHFRNTFVMTHQQTLVSINKNLKLDGVFVSELYLKRIQLKCKVV